jgi:hypothetical protein
MRLALISNAVTGIIAKAPELARKGNLLGLYIPDALYPKQPVNSSFTYFPLPSLPDYFHKNSRIITSFPTQIPSLLDKFRPDIVHFENPQIHLFSPVYYWCKIHKKPLITSTSGSRPSFINKNLYTMSDLIFDPLGKDSYDQILSRLLHR